MGLVDTIVKRATYWCEEANLGYETACAIQRSLNNKKWA